eukprot:TRINITY_DN99_c0_g1::TRINITY_DN99_c0_g1_i1::g.14781::m.14781 TRINITY_DN99_c0_g1::TRINITY_DN99_c0_g1_i1::g.14781  ORF type:complete len:121 (+),score=-1.60,sp/Q58794/Y1399_METJA/29.81/1e-08,AAA_18/PF13238.1/0.061 TRINITY_DN99_c0_g1_i1:288-650(+)
MLALPTIETYSSLVIDSMRHPNEVEFLKKHNPMGFFLIAVTAEPNIRYARMLQRSRTGDVSTFDRFLKVEEQEAKNPNPNGQQLLKTIALADCVLDNSRSMAELYSQLDKLVTERLERSV